MIDVFADGMVAFDETGLRRRERPTLLLRNQRSDSRPITAARPARQLAAARHRGRLHHPHLAADAKGSD